MNSLLFFAICSFPQICNENKNVYKARTLIYVTVLAINCVKLFYWTLFLEQQKRGTTNKHKAQIVV